MRKARLVLADGTIFRGRAFGASGERSGELAFHTGMTGYEEAITSPANTGLLLAMTYPEIGNYGINVVDAQSARPAVAGLVVREYCEVPSNWRSRGSLESFLVEHGVVGISGIDTRALTRRLRAGVQAGVLTDDEQISDAELLARAQAAQGTSGRDLASAASTREAYDWTEGRPQVLPADPAPPPASRKVTVVDLGASRGLLRELVSAGCAVRVVPNTTPSAEILAGRPDGVVLSDGPGDPAAVAGTKALVEGLVGRVPVLGVGLGHQLLALGLGGRTVQLPAGHRDASHPVRTEGTHQVTLTEQSHGYAVVAASLEGRARVTGRSLVDDAVEAFEVPGARAMGVQYVADAAVLGRFARLMEDSQ